MFFLFFFMKYFLLYFGLWLLNMWSCECNFLILDFVLIGLYGVDTLFLLLINNDGDGKENGINVGGESNFNGDWKQSHFFTVEMNFFGVLFILSRRHEVKKSKKDFKRKRKWKI